MPCPYTSIVQLYYGIHSFGKIEALYVIYFLAAINGTVFKVFEIKIHST